MMADSNSNDEESTAEFSERGAASSLKEQKEMGLVTFEQVLDLIPVEEKVAYLEAVTRCPDLVATESDPSFFIVRDDYNLWAAARRLVAYWESRKEVFGETRAFLPLNNLTGHGGALDVDDIAALNTGWFALLPRDAAGCPVAVMDMSRCVISTTDDGDDGKTREISDGSLVRSAFYLRSVFAKEEIVQKKGFVVILVYGSKWYQTMTSSKMFRRFSGKQIETIPARTKMKYIVNVSKLTYFQQVVPLFKGVKNSNQMDQMIPLVSDSQGDLLRKLETYQFSKDGLPASVGGTWSYDSFRHWVAEEGGGRIPDSEEQGHGLPSYLQSYCTQLETDENLSSSSSSALGGELPVSAMTTMLSDFYEALDLIPFEQKAAYVEAVQRSPELIQEESNPMWFLVSEKNNPWLAARRLAKFWEYRKEAFQDRAFLPINATGEGALTEETIRMVKSGAFRFLPSDSHGRAVLWFDRSKLPKPGKGEITSVGAKAAGLKWWLYLLSVVYRRASVQKNGLVLMIVFDAEFFKRPILASVLDTMKNVVTQAMPIGSFQTQIVCSSMVGEAGLSLVVDLVGRESDVLMATSHDEMREKLKARVGLKKESIPVEFGGTWTEDQDATWQKERERIECDLNERFSLSVHITSSRKRFRHSDNGSGVEGKIHPSQNCISQNFAAELQKAVDALPVNDKADYLLACSSVPHLVKTDSNPQLFWAFEDQDFAATARRLTTYWRLRREIFGRRAFLPMDLSASGVMTAEDIAALRQGPVVPLPTDERGISVLWLGKQPASLPHTTWLRILFFALRVVCENPHSQSRGFVVLKVPCRGKHLHSLNDLVQDAFPSHFTAVHLISISRKSESPEHSVEVVRPPTIEDISKSLVDKTFYHFAENRQDMLVRLEWSGFSKEALPTVVGGTLELERYVSDWIQGQSASVSMRPDKVTSNTNASLHTPGQGGCRSTAQAPQNALAELNRAIHQLRDAEKEAYLEALSKVPELVEKESNPSWYLQHDKYNIRTASQHLLSYWKKRKEVFGTRFLLPMNMTGEGALSKEDVAFLSTGSLVFLPEDKKGRSVLCYDASRTEGTAIGALLGVMFYSALLCTQNNVSRFEGVVLLVPVSHMTRTEQLAQIQEIVQVFPFTWHAIHVISKSTEPQLMKCCAPKAIGHKVTSNKEILRELASHGMLKSGLPDSLGGDWCYSQHALWQEQRIRIEWDLPSLCSTFESNGKRSYNLTEEEKAERKRRYNVLHAKRKRHRDKVEVEVLKKQVEDLKFFNLKATREHERLENLVEQANIEVARANQGEAGQDVLPAAATSGILTSLPINVAYAHADHMRTNQQMDIDEMPLAATAVNSTTLTINFDGVDVRQNPSKQWDPDRYEPSMNMASDCIDQRQAHAPPPTTWTDFPVAASQAATLNSFNFPVGVAGSYIHPQQVGLQLPLSTLTGGQTPPANPSLSWFDPEGRPSSTDDVSLPLGLSLENPLLVARVQHPGENVGPILTNSVANAERQQLLQQQLNNLQQQRPFSQLQAPTGFAQAATPAASFPTNPNSSTTSNNDQWEALVMQLAAMSNGGVESMDFSYRHAP